MVSEIDLRNIESHGIEIIMHLLNLKSNLSRCMTKSTELNLLVTIW